MIINFYFPIFQFSLITKLDVAVHDSFLQISNATNEMDLTKLSVLWFYFTSLIIIFLSYVFILLNKSLTILYNQTQKH